MHVTPASIEDLPAVLTVFDAALLETDVDVVRDAIDRGDVLVAQEDDRVLGALLLVDDRIDAIAVHRERRDRGVGTALVETACDRRDRVVAEFDPRVRPFWEALDFAIEPVDDTERYRGVWPTGNSGDRPSGDERE